MFPLFATKTPAQTVRFLDRRAHGARHALADYAEAPAEMPLPAGFPAAVAAARRLSAEVDFARFDFLAAGDGLWAGEITLFAAAGYAEFARPARGLVLGVWDLRHSWFPARRREQGGPTHAKRLCGGACGSYRRRGRRDRQPQPRHLQSGPSLSGFERPRWRFASPHDGLRRRVALSALGGADGLRTAPELAAETGLAEPTVAKVLKLLGQAGLVDGLRGARGGYRLRGRWRPSRLPR